MTHRDKLTALHPQSVAMRTLQRLVEQRRALVDDKTRITNRLGDALKQYFPQALEWFKDKDTVVFCDFLTHWPTLKDAQRARKARLTAFFYEHNVALSQHCRAARTGHPGRYSTDLRQRRDRPQPAAGRGLGPAAPCRSTSYRAL